MKLEEITNFIEERIPPALALDFDSVGFSKDYDSNQDIESIRIYMDLLADDDDFDDATLVITHHPPLFIPKTPTYTIHSNWDIIDGGANEALAHVLGLDVIGCFDDETGIGRICQPDYDFGQLKEIISDNFSNVRIVNALDGNAEIERIGIISGFGLKNPDYVRLAKDKNLDILISGDLCQETAILALNLGITLIDLNHHESEVPGLYALCEIFSELDVECEVIDKRPIERL